VYADRDAAHHNKHRQLELHPKANKHEKPAAHTGLPPCQTQPKPSQSLFIITHNCPQINQPGRHLKQTALSGYLAAWESNQCPSRMQQDAVKLVTTHLSVDDTILSADASLDASIPSQLLYIKCLCSLS
jgi:hypothetical protein